MKRLRAPDRHCPPHFLFQQSTEKQWTPANAWAALLLGVSVRLPQAVDTNLGVD